MLLSARSTSRDESRVELIAASHAPPTIGFGSFGDYFANKHPRRQTHGDVIRFLQPRPSEARPDFCSLT
jgi:hypothetical protein